MAAAEARERKPHVVTDLPSRRWKAQKIERLLGLDELTGPLRLLEIGTGTGGIAQYFAAQPGGRFEVDAVDVVDSRSGDADFRFTLVSDTTLPFPDASFDVVLSNHVIEHVGDDAAQRRHLAELSRVLRAHGRGYLAVPNRWMLTEPHYHLPFLSWLPRGLRSPYLRMAGKGEFYDCEPLTLPALERLLAEAGLSYRTRGAAALRATFDIERARRLSTRTLARVPDALLRPFSAAIPTHIYTFTHGR
jgi:SAM-dependent methyltransferase